MDEREREEFEWFRELERKLVRVFTDDGHGPRQAQELGFLMAQAVRDVPKLLAMLDEAEKHSADELTDAVHDVLANRFSLMEAARLLGLSNERG